MPHDLPIGNERPLVNFDSHYIVRDIYHPNAVAACGQPLYRNLRGYDRPDPDLVHGDALERAAVKR